MEQDSFWRKALLGGFAEDCIYHAIIPSVFVTLPPSPLPVPPPHISADDYEDVARAYADFEFCSLCHTSQRGGKPVQYGLRFLLARRQARRIPDDGNIYWIYRTAFTDACICLACAVTTHGILAHVDSGSDMFHMTMDVIETCDATQLTELAYTPGAAGLSGPEYWARLVERFRATTTSSIARAICRMDARCNHCNRPDVNYTMLVCSGCRYVRYCSRACSVAEWPTHKHACTRLKSGDHFYSDKAVEMNQTPTT